MSRSIKTSKVMGLLNIGTEEKPQKDDILEEKVKPSRKKTVLNENEREKFVTKGNNALKNPAFKPLTETFLLNKNKIMNPANILIYENIAEIADKFQICTCNECLAVIVKITSEQLPQKFIRINNSDDAEKFETEKTAIFDNVIMVLEKVCKMAKTKMQHNISKNR